MLTRHLAASFAVAAGEHSALATVDALLQQCHTDEQRALGTTDSAALYDFDAAARVDGDEAAQRELEEDLASAVGGMRSFAQSFATHLRDDARRVDRLAALQRTGGEGMGGNMRGLLDFEKLASGLGLMRLLYMALIAVGLTFVTLVFVYIDAMIF